MDYLSEPKRSRAFVPREVIPTIIVDYDHLANSP